MSRIEHVYVNGEIVAADDARLSAFDGGISHGAGLFTTLRTYHGKPFRLPAHLARMRRSAERLALPMPSEDGEIDDAVRRLLRASGLGDARLRITITPGSVRAAAGDSPSPTVLITAQQAESYPPEFYRRGMTVCVSSFKQHKDEPTVGHKTVSYFSRLLALREAHRKHCGEAIWFTTDNHLAEGSISNIFVVRDETVLTPPVDTPLLPGIARAVVLEVCAALRITALEQPLTINHLLEADQVFLTNSIMEVMPVCRIERHAVGDEKVGDVTRRLHEGYRDVVWKECPPDA